MVRFSDEDWEAFDQAAKSLGTDRSALLRQFVHWFLRRRGASLPKRP